MISQLMMSLALGRKLELEAAEKKGRTRNLYKCKLSFAFLRINHKTARGCAVGTHSLPSICMPHPCRGAPFLPWEVRPLPISSSSFLCKAPPSVMFFLPISDDVTSSDKLSLVPKSCKAIFLRTLQVPFVTCFMLLKLVYQSVVG